MPSRPWCWPSSSSHGAGFWIGLLVHVGRHLDGAFYPGVNYFAKSIQAGRFPLWFPGVRNGLPFIPIPKCRCCIHHNGSHGSRSSKMDQVADSPGLPTIHRPALPARLWPAHVAHFSNGSNLVPLERSRGALVFCLSGFASLRIVNFVMIQVYVASAATALCCTALLPGGGRPGLVGSRRGDALVLAGGTPTDHGLLLVPGCRVLVVSQLWCATRTGIDWKRAGLPGGGEGCAEIDRDICPRSAGLGRAMVIPAKPENWRHAGRTASVV